MKISPTPVSPPATAIGLARPAVASPMKPRARSDFQEPWLDLGHAEIQFSANFGATGDVRLGASRALLTAGHHRLNDALAAARQLSVGKHGAVAVIEFKSPYPVPSLDPPRFSLRRIEAPDLRHVGADPSLAPLTTFHPEQGWPDNGRLRRTLGIQAKPMTIFGGLAMIVDGDWEWRRDTGIKEPPRTPLTGALPV